VTSLRDTRCVVTAPTLALPYLPGANCQGWPEPLWDNHVDGERPAERQQRHSDARLWCNTCPVKAACLQVGLAEHLPGIWGGSLLQGRSVLKEAG
jgi:hypothetical protein